MHRRTRPPDAVDVAALTDVGAYVALPRVSQLSASADGATVLATVQRLSDDGTAYDATYWVIPDGGRPVFELTLPSPTARQPLLVSASDVVYLDDPDDSDACGDGAGDATPLVMRWSIGTDEPPRRLPTSGFRVERLVPAGPSTLVAVAAVLDDTPDAVRRRDARRRQRVTAVLHDSYPARDLAVDIGAEVTHLVALDLAGETAPIDLTPGAGREHRQATVLADRAGSTVFATAHVGGHVERRAVVRAIDIATGRCETIVDRPGWDATPADVSADGEWLVCLESAVGSDEPRTVREMTICRRDGTDRRVISDAIDEVWYPEARFAGIERVVLAPAKRHAAPIISVTTGLGTSTVAGEVATVTSGPHCHANLTVAPDGGRCHAIRSSVSQPPQVVGIDLVDGATDVVVDPTPDVQLPGRVEIVRTSVDHDAAADAPADPDRAVVTGGILVLPDGASPDAPAPLLTFLHGGPVGAWGGWYWGWNPWPAVARGYAVLLPNTAMSLGFGREHAWRGSGRWGAEPYEEIVALCEAVQTRPDISSRSALLGCSWGGYMTNWAAGQTDRFDAIVTHAGIWDLGSLMSSTDIAPLAAAWIPEADLERWSPASHVDSIVTPMLIIHGDRDYRIPVSQALAQWSDLLVRIPEGAPQPHRLLVFPDEHHVVLKPQNMRLWHEAVLAFVDVHVRDEPWRRPDSLG